MTKHRLCYVESLIGILSDFGAFVFFFTYLYCLFKRFTFVLVGAENSSEGFGSDSCAGSQDLGECVYATVWLKQRK